MKYIMGIDIGGTTTKIGFFSDSHKLLKKWEIKTDTRDKGSHILNDISNSINDFLFHESIDIGCISGFGIGVPGATINNVVDKCDNIGWPKFNVEKEFRKYFKNGKIVVCNDANVAALGELKCGAAKDFDSCVLMTLGTGVGGGVIVDGKIVEGVDGSAGEIGHMKVVFDNPTSCNCGKKGCLETVSSATGIIIEARKMIKKYKGKVKTVLIDDENLTCKAVFDASKEQDEVALKVVEFVCEKLALASSYIALTINPSAIIIGGGVSNAGDILIKTIGKYYKEFTYNPALDTKFIIAKLGNDAGIFGASYLIV